jgi:hypothetical protein
MNGNGSGNGNGNGSLPAWARVIYTVGVPAAIALFLVWILAASVQADLKTVIDDHQSMKWNLWRVCVNTSLSRELSQQCVPPVGPGS